MTAAPPTDPMAKLDRYSYAVWRRVLTRYIALYAMPMMAGAAQFWLVRKGFYFTHAGAELPLVWLALLGLQAMLGDGPLAVVASPGPRQLFARATANAAPARARKHA